MNLNHQATPQIADHMIKKVIDQLESILMLHCSQLSEDQTGRAYYGVNFQLGNKHFKFRKAKITPKKWDYSLRSGNVTPMARPYLLLQMIISIITLFRLNRTDISAYLSSQNRR